MAMVQCFGIILLLVGVSLALHSPLPDSQNQPPFTFGDDHSDQIRRQVSNTNHQQTSILNLTVTPERVTEGITDFLELSCFFSGSTNLMSLGISKRRENGTQGLVYVMSAKSDEVVTMDPLFPGEVSGGIAKDDKSGNITIKWKAPSSHEAGVYECLASSMEAFGQMTNEKKVVHVIVRPVNADDLSKYVIERFQQLESTIVGQRRAMAEMNATLNAESKEMAEVKATLTTERKALSIIQNTLFTKSSPYRGHTYYLSEYSMMSYTKAREICKAMGGYVAEINDRNEMQFLRSFLSPRLSRKFVIIIAGTDVQQENTWVFERTGQRVPYLDWAPGQPNGGEHCLVLVNNSGDIAMYDFFCHSVPSINFLERLGVLCEME